MEFSHCYNAYFHPSASALGWKVQGLWLCSVRIIIGIGSREAAAEKEETEAMKKILLMPDSFKGTLSSGEICALMERAVKKHFPQCEVISVPIADGGEGSVDCFLSAVGGEKVTTRVKGPLFEDIEAGYGIIHGGATAVIEVAATAGLPLIGDRKDPRRATTYGCGEQMRHAMEGGIRKLVVGLGGSATNDGGAGAMAALGAAFYNAAGETFIPTGGTLKDIARIDPAGLIPQIGETEIVTMCDIDNPLCGPSGAAFVFAPQKGADGQTVRELDEGLAHYGRIVRRDLGVDITGLPGAGAAGGMGGAMAAFLNSRLSMGIQVVLDNIGFESLCQGADLIFTGEGCLDSQSLRGKAVIGIGRRAKPLGVPVVAVVGTVGGEVRDLSGEGIACVFTTNRRSEPTEAAMRRGRENMEQTMDNLMALIRTVESRG